MVIESKQNARRVGYLLLAVCLVLLTVGLAGIIVMVSSAYGPADEAARRVLLRMAWVASVSLGLTLIMLLWVVIRWVRLRIKLPPKTQPTEYIDAWSEAGKRMPAPDHEELEPDDEPAE
jgi:Na+-driven multidrug efflux pump